MKLQVRRAVPLDGADATVVIPCYNYGRFLEAAARAALDQPGVEMRVIIVDDASTDDSLAVARVLEQRYPEVQVIAHAANRGHIATYNDGLAAVRTEFVTLVSADDLVAPGSLTRSIELMRAHPGVGLVYGRPLSFTDGGSPRRAFTMRPTTWSVWGGTEWMGLSSWRGRSFVLSPEVVMRTAALREVGGYNAGLPHSGDLEYWLRTAARWDIGRINGPIQAYYRVHASNMHLTTFLGMAADLRHRAAAFDVLDTDEIAGLVPRSRAMLHTARRKMARQAMALSRRELARGGAHAAAAELRDIAVGLDGSVRFSRLAHKVDGLLARGESRSVTPADTLAEFARERVEKMRSRIWAHVGIA
jgi:glycosyltransferase involved in cell wall biosynthesis